jgi:hypothetical protein
MGAEFCRPQAGFELAVALARASADVARSWTKALRGLANAPDPEGYLDKERDSWD